MRRQLEALRRSLPQGQTLPGRVWRQRHRGILVLLWFHSVAIPAFALARGYALDHIVLEAAIVPVAAIVATWPQASRRVRTGAASVGLLSSSAVLVHLSGGVIEMHFHFFVMVTVVALYQDWLPFLASIGYVLVHHGALGALDPTSVYNHPAAIGSPWKWAAIHAFFIAGISAVCLVTWRLNETILAQRRQAELRLRQETRVVETLNEVGRALAAELDLHNVVSRVTDAATSLTSAAIGAFFYNVTDDSGESYMLYSLSGAPREAFAGFPMPRNTAVFGPTFAGEGPVRLDDVLEDPRYGKSGPYFGMPPGHFPVRSYLAVPVKSRSGEVLGGLFFGHPEPGRFSDVDERIVTGIASHAAVAIDNARLYESERHARETAEQAQRYLALLAEASQALASSLELEAILGHLARVVVPAIADSCVVFLSDDDGGIRRAATRFSAEIQAVDEMALAPVDPSNGAHPVVRAIRSGTPELIETIDDSVIVDSVAGDDERAAVRRLGPVSAIVVPLVRRNEVLGAITVATVRSSGRVLGESELALIEEVARRGALAVENAGLYAAQRGVAESLQHSLLPDLPEIPGLAVAARYRPGGPAIEVGGDWYDIFPLPDGSVALAMGDVVGHGVPAASLMGQLRNALRAYALDGHGPARLVDRLNRLMIELGHADHMATLVYAVFDPETGELRVCNAGHPPPLVIAPEGATSLLEHGGGVPLGASARARYTEASTRLRPGATLLLFTDGLIEDRITTLDEGLARLDEAVANAPADIERLCDHLLERGLEGREVSDDVAILAVRPIVLGDRFHLQVPATPTILRPLRATLRRWLAEVGTTEQEAFEVLVASGEACANAIQHGATASSFDLDVEVNGDLRIVVRDRGRWRRPRPTGGGRGLGIMEQFMDHVDLATGADGTEVTMTRMLTGAPDPEDDG